MYESLLKHLLRPLTRIIPDGAYMKRSKELISFAGQEAPLKPLRVRFMSRIFESITITAGVALASLLLVIGLGSLSYLKTTPSGGQVATSFNNESLAMEATLSDFNMQIQAISYFDQSAKQVAMALDKISDKTNEIKN